MRRTFVMTVAIAVLVAATIRAGGADVRAVLDSTDGSSAFVVQDGQSNDLLRVRSDGVVDACGNTISNAVLSIDSVSGLRRALDDKQAGATTGTLVHVDSDSPGNSAEGLWGDGDFVYLANGSGGLHTYSVDGSGTLAHIDSHYAGGSACDVWGDSNFVYLANTGGGLQS